MLVEFKVTEEDIAICEQARKDFFSSTKLIKPNYCSICLIAFCLRKIFPTAQMGVFAVSLIDVYHPRYEKRFSIEMPEEILDKRRAFDAGNPITPGKHSFEVPDDIYEEAINASLAVV